MLGWIRHYRLLGTEAEVGYFRAMRMPELVARLYPNAIGVDLDAMADLMGIVGLLNDQIDSPACSRAAAATEICHDLLSFYDGSGVASATSYGRAWRELWSRLTKDMSEAWQAHVRRLVREFFATYLRRIDRSAGVPSVAQYMETRKITAFVEPMLLFGERVGHFELPNRVRQVPVLRDLLAQTEMLMYLPNDVHAVEREEQRGEVNNMLLVLERANACSRTRAIEHIRTMVRQASERFLELESQIPAMCEKLRLDAAETSAVAKHVQDMRYMIGGVYEWARGRPARYAPEAAALAVACGYQDPS
ncbi:hypothetical protein LZC95_32520 [Pendulispora brunnea]|uniref:Terpene synthase n=1 Tax=Pendulispora brunnea TaxID=2905690 RepID=A0ABZ2JXD9_9BACT